MRLRSSTYLSGAFLFAVARSVRPPAQIQQLFAVLGGRQAEDFRAKSRGCATVPGERKTKLI